jgi:hypothetical protein
LFVPVLMFVLQHIVFALTGLMQYVIPDVPSEVRRSDAEEQLLDDLFQLKTQIQREALLAKEAKYEHGLKKSDNDMYEDLMHTLKENNNPRLETTRPGKRVVLENLGCNVFCSHEGVVGSEVEQVV